MLSARRSGSCLDVCDFNSLIHREHDTTISLTKNYLLSLSPPPMTYRDLRSVMSNKIPSNIVIFPESINSSQNSTTTIRMHEGRKSAHRKSRKRTSIDVYRSLMRMESRCSTLSERDVTNDEMILLANSFALDRNSPSPTNGFFYPPSSPNIQKHRIINNNSRIFESIKTKSNFLSSPSLRIEHFRHVRPISRQTEHPKTTVDIQYEENSDDMAIITTTTTTMISSNIPEKQTRKELHVYMPQIVSC